MKENKSTGEDMGMPSAPKTKDKKPRVSYPAIHEPALPILLLAVCAAIALVALLIDRFVFSFSDNLLAPAITVILAMILPCHLVLLLIRPGEKLGGHLRELGMRRISPSHVFFIIFAALLMMCLSVLFIVFFSGIPPKANGLTLLGTFTAGRSEFSSSVPYLILSYALIPAIAEEILLRGIVFGEIKKISLPLAVLVSCAGGMLLELQLSLGTLLSSFAASLVLAFVLYTTQSLGACMIVHFIYNLYRLFLEGNISIYYASAYNNILFVIVFLVILLTASALFAAECARIYRSSAKKISDGEQKSRPLKLSFKELKYDLGRTFAFRPTLICAIAFATIFVAAAVIGILT